MNSGEVKPDVVVVGMPSCGKTVFFTVLGKKFTNIVDGRRTAPLGFRMGTCDKDTAKVVNDAYDRLRNGKWPEATKTGQIMPLRWEVFTGRRRVFELYSMDIAGETFRKAFGIEDGMDAPGAKSRVKSRKKAVDADSELLPSEALPDDAAGGDGSTTGEDEAVEHLKNAIASAKVVCFMVNVALPGSFRGRKLSEADETKLLRFRNSVTNMYLSLKEQPGLRAKSVIVLTQTHLHEAEIERAGGPVMYLGDVCGGEAAELCNLAKEKGVPVIAVSAINEERDVNELPEINAPSDIPSSGLFGFLLTVAGMAARDDDLSRVKDAYLAYLRERVEYLKSPALDVKLRLRQARKYHKASAAYVDACIRYLTNADNLADGSGVPLPPGMQKRCLQCTKADPEVREAADREYLVRDELWDRALRRAAVSKRQGAAVAVPGDIRDEVWEGLLAAFPEKRGNEGNDAFLFGFGEEDLSQSETPTCDKWVEYNLDEYRADLEAGIAELNARRVGVRRVVDDMKLHVGKVGFERCREEAEKACSALADKLAAFRAAWFGGESPSLPEVESMEGEVDKQKELIGKYTADHGQTLHKAKALRVLRNCVLGGMLLFALIVAGLYGAHAYLDKANRDCVRNVGMLISRSDFAHARQKYGSLADVKWLGVVRDDYLCAQFPERLALAEKAFKAHESASELNKELEGLRKWLDGIEDSSEEVNNARKECENALNSYKTLPPPASFNDIVQQGVDIESRVLTTQKCELSLKSAVDKIEKMQKGWKEHLRKAAFMGEMQEAKRQLGEIDSMVDNLEMASVPKNIEVINGLIGKLQELAGLNDDDIKSAQGFRNSADEVVKRLKAKQTEHRNQVFEAMLADVRLALASNSVSQVWNKYDEADEFSSSAEEREKLAKLHEEVLGFTVEAYKRTLSEVEKNANMLRAETAISVEMIDKTRKSLKVIERVRDGLRRHIPETRDDFNRIESLAENVQAKLPVIVQIDGVRQFENQPVNIKNAGRESATILNGTSSKTLKQCVYILVLQNELPTGSSRLVRVVDENGRTAGLSIRLSDLVPGINRFEKAIN